MYLPITSVAVYNPMMTLLLGVVTKTKDRAFRRHFRDIGVGSFTVRNNNPAIAAGWLDYGNVIQFRTTGDVPIAAWIIEDVKKQTVAGGEEAEQVSEYSGRGNRARWADMTVYPERRAWATHDVRILGWQSHFFSDASWGFAVQTEQGTGDVGGPREGFPIGLPVEAETAWWIQSQANDVNGSVPAGDQYFRGVYNSPGEYVEIVITADNSHALYLDGELLHVDSVLQAGGVGWAGIKVVRKYLGTGLHLFAVKITNVAGVDPNPSGFIMSVIRLLNAGSERGPVVFESTSAWKALGYPASPPGFTVGHALRVLTNEYSDRGGPVLSLGFTDALDSGGNPWAVAPDITIPIGIDGVALLKQIAEVYADIVMDQATLRLDAWNKGAKGGPTGITYTPGVNVDAMLHEKPGGET